MNTRNRRSALAILFVVLGCWFVQQPGSAAETSTALTPLSVSTDTGEKPQSKVWFHRGTWWAVLPSTSPSGTWVWRLNPNNSWSNVLQLSARTDVKADVKHTGAVTHVLLYAASSPGATELASIEYVASGNTYQLWSLRTLNTPIALPASSETATIDTDSSGRLWLATKAITSVVVYYSDAPYTVVNGPVTLETGINADDISLVTALPNNKVGVLWSNQQTKRFGFRVHADGADPGTWSADELPASQSAQDIGLGMADDHMNVAVAADGTLYAAVKTSYDTGGSTKIALLVRRPTGVWDNLYHVDVNGTRPIVLLDELTAKVRVVYSSSESGPDIVYKESSISAIDFSGPAQLLMSGSGGALNNATSTKQNWTGRVVVLASTASAARGVLISREDPTLAGYWPMNDGSGALARDHSGFGSDGILQGNAAWIAGVNGAAVDLDGTGDYVLVPESRNLDITAAITMAAWVKPERQATQDLIKKATVGTVDGYELSLATVTSTGKAFVRFNQATSGDTYRLDALNLYPSDGNTWIHLAATYDGAIMRLYVNGVLQGEKAGPTAIASNALSVGIGAQPSDGTRALMGQLDDVRIYNRALNATEIATLAEASLEADLSITKSNGQSSVTAGQTVSYTIVASNNGPAPVSGATVTDTLPAAFTGATWTCSASAASSCPASGTGSLAAQVNLAAGGTATFTLNATVAAGASGSVVNTASVAAPSGISDPTGSNNSATDTDTVLAPPTPGLNAGLAGYWKMDEGSGTTLVDVSGNANNATTVGGPTWGTGKDGLALTLNGSTQYATAAHNSTLNITGPMTMAGWVKTSTLATQSLIKKATGSAAGTGGYELSLSATAPGTAFVRLSDATAVYRANSTTSYPTGTWIHLAATYDGTRIRLYFNGIQEADVAGPSSTKSNALALGIGAQSDGASGRLQGQLDEVRIYTRALTANEIVSLATNTAPAVSAGADQAISLPASASLVGTVSDDGLPNPPATVALAWLKASGPGTVSFGSPSSTSTSASFSVAGTYTLRLTADDGMLTSSDDVTVTVSSGAPANEPPVVNAGPDQTIALPAQASLAGIVTDDGQPTGTLSATWSTLSGPAAAVFTNASSANSSASFPTAGTYVLRLTASDGALSSSDDVSITVSDPIFVGAGDIVPDCTAGASIATAQATAALLNAIPGTIFTLGDNAYQNGTAQQFSQCYNAAWGGALKARTRPATGNHDYNTANATPYFDYFNGAGNFTGPAGDRDKGYYSYNLGNWHIVVLNSECGSSGLWDVNGCAVGSSQEQWLRSDLASSPTNNIIATWHKPRFSSSATDSSIAFMQPLWQALYEHGADLVLGGHWHNYERLAPTNANGARDDVYGVRQFVVGTGGVPLSGFGATRATSELRNNTTHGVLKLTLHEDSYDWEFVPVAGGTFSDSGSAAVHGTPPGPTVTSVTPAVGTFSGGTAVTITGTNFGTLTPTTVRFGTLAATAVTCSSATTCTATSPAGTGTVDVTVSVGEQTSPATTATRFTYNQRPAVDAGSDQTITLPANASLNGTVTDDGAPNPPGLVSVTWSLVSGPGAVSFTNANASATAATFSAAGVYVLRLTASDGMLTNSDDVTVAVNPGNQAPIVDAGANQTITFPSSVSLSGTASDDGLPNPPGTLTLTWSKVSGAGAVTFANVNALSTTATFTLPGTYVLQLAAFDGVLTSTDTVTVMTRGLVGHWQMNEGSGTTLVDSSGLNNAASLAGSPAWANGIRGPALTLDGTTQNGLVPNSASLNPTAAITLAVWIKPAKAAFATQDLIKKAVAGSTNGYELSLAVSGKPFFRLNQVASADTYRVNALSSYPLNGTAWQHLVATYDGSSMHIYVNGVLEGSVTGPSAIVANSLSVGIGAQSDATRRFEGAMDDARVYDRALSAEEIRLLANRPPTVNAGADQTINLPAGASVSGSVTDDSVPTAVVTTTWTQVSGPGTVSFGNPAATSTSASFSAAGVYVLSLAATDGDLSSADTLTVTVQQPVNQAPAVNAGSDQTITLPSSATLDGTVNDDGLPAGAMTTAWTKVSGPGTVAFGDTATVDTTAGFSVAGVYVLRLTANDGGLASTDDVTITVNPVPGDYALDFGGTNGYAAFGNPAKLHLTSFTIETWFNRQGAGTTTTTGTGGVTAAIPLVTRGRGEAESAAADTNYFLGIDTATNVLAADFEEGATGSSPSLNHPVRGVTTIAATDNRWRHAAATYDGTTWRLYLDGQLERELFVGQPAAAAGNQHAAIASALSTTGVAAGFFDGLLDEVRIWDYARTPGEIRSAVNQRIPTATGLVARWALDEAVGTSVADSTDTPASGAIAGTNWSWVTGAPFNLNLRPIVDAGIDQTITLPANAALSGSVSDDGLPDPPASVTITWTKVSGPGTALFQSPNTAATTVSFSTAGTYVLQLAAADGEHLSMDTVTVNVNASGPVNQAPAVNAGPDQTVTLPAPVALSAAVTDDGLPGTDVTTTWSKVTGPGTVTFADATATATSASFSAPGTYVLQLTADDGELSASDAVTIVVSSTAVNSALDLGGTNAYVNLGPSPGLGASTFTLELWFRRDGAGIATSTGSGGLSAIPLVTKGMAEGDGSTIDMNYFLGIRGTDGVLGADFEDRANGANHPVVGTTPILADGTWHHAAATYDGSTWRVYLDGALEIAQSVGAFTPRYDSTQWAAIGSASNSTGGVGTQTRGFFDGAVDEVRIWNFARTPQQILESLNQEISSAQGLLGRWGFSEGAGTTISDSSGNGLLGTVVGTSFLWVGGAPFRLNQAPGQPVLQAPLNGATGVATSPTLNVAVTDPDGDPMAVTFFGRPVPAGAAPEFTIVALPDTQHYVDDPTRAATFTSQTQWVVDNQAAKNIAFVTHLGDIVEHIDAQPIEWTRANSSLSLLEASNLKWGLAPGNHDMNSAGVATNFDLTFPVSRFSGSPWYGGYLGMDAVQDPVDRQNKDSYQLFSVGGLDFVIIHLEYDMPDYSVAWANRILAQYPNRRAIITTHLFLNASGSRPTTVLNRTNGTPAETVWQQLVRNNCNVFMVLNGHYPGEANRTDLNNCGRPVHQLASDYQSRINGGDGWLRYLTFKPAENKIFVYTYSPTLNGGAGLFETDANSQFVLDYDMQGAAFSAIATNSGIPSGSSATATWAELPAGTAFQWYVTATDGAATTTSPTWTFTTSQPNGAPVVTNPGAQSSAEGASPNLQIVASDPDGTALTYSATGLPTGLAINATTGVISGTVAFGAAVSNSVVVTVSDGTVTGTASFTWTVTRTNGAPVVTNPGAQSSAEGASPNLQIVASDPDGTTLTYSATGLPTGLAINATTGVISGTVAFGAAVSNSVVVTVSDGTATDTASFTWTVTRTNRAPVVTNPGDQTNAEGTSPSLQIVASDPDGTALTYSATGLPTGLAINATTGVISGTVAFGAALSNSVVVTVSDGTVTGTASFTWTVTRTNGAPVVTNPGAQSSAEGASPNLQIVASDPDGTALTYSATGLPTGLAINVTTGVISGTVAFGAAVSNSVVVTVSDGTLSATADFVWTISNTNRAPVAVSVTFTTPKNRTLTANLTATDPDGDTFTFVLVAQGRKGTAIINAQTGAFTYSPVGNPNGTDTFTFKANDGTADSNVATVTIKFTAATANTPPVASTGTVSINEDVSGTGNLVASDAEGTALTYRIGTNGTKGSATANSSTGAFTYVPLTNANGTDSFTFIANDGTSDSNVAVVTVTIAAVNDAPVASNDTATTAVNTSVTIAVLTNDSDPDQETPTVASVSGATNGTVGFTDTQIVYTPNTGFVGSDTFTYVVKDAAGALSAQATVTVTITGANARPIAQGQSIATMEDSAHPIVLTGTDAEGSALTFTIVAAPTHGTLTGTGANVTYTPASNYNGSDTFTFVVNDGVVDSAPATVAITVNAVNDLPVASDLAVVTTKGQTVTGTLLATDVDGGVLTFEVVMQPKKGTVSVDPSGGFTYTPNPAAKGNDTFTFRASDGSLMSNSAKVTVTIR